MGKFSRKRKPLPKKWLLMAAGGLLAAAALGAGVFLLPASGEAVSVYPFQQIGMTEYWGDSQESYGPVSTDKIQTVFLSETQTVTEVKVAQGDAVKKGDLLLTFDTTLSELQLERKRLAMEKEKFQLTLDKARLQELKNMIPYYPPAAEPPAEEDKGEMLIPEYPKAPDTPYADLCFDKEGLHDGSSEDKAVICWFTDAKFFQTDPLLEWIRSELQAKWYPEPPAADPDSTAPTEPSDPTDPADATTATGPTETTAATEPTQPEPPKEVREFYVVFKVTDNNYAKGQKLLWQGMKITKESLGFSIRYFVPAIQDYTEFTQEEEAPPVYEDYSSGYTPEQLSQMKAQQLKTIAEQDFKARMAEAEYKLMEAELKDGNIYAEIDGVVVSLLQEEEAKAGSQPLLKVSGGGGFLIEGSVSELEKDNLEIGQTVTVNDWSTGSTYEGTVQSIGDFPSSQNGWTGMGNPNATYYPFLVFVSEEADLRAGSYANIQYSAADSAQGIYLENPFLRTEEGRTYVLARGSGGRLEKRFVSVGKSLWGSYTEIRSGVAEEDFLAFPYAKEAKPGAQTKEGDLMELYSY